MTARQVHVVNCDGCGVRFGGVFVTSGEVREAARLAGWRSRWKNTAGQRRGLHDWCPACAADGSWR